MPISYFILRNCEIDEISSDKAGHIFSYREISRYENQNRRNKNLYRGIRIGYIGVYYGFSRYRLVIYLNAYILLIIYLGWGRGRLYKEFIEPTNMKRDKTKRSREITENVYESISHEISE